MVWPDSGSRPPEALGIQRLVLRHGGVERGCGVPLFPSHETKKGKAIKHCYRF